MSYQLNIPVIAGPPLLGYLLNWGLYGALSVQAHWYYIAFPGDHWQAKSLVLFLYAVETAQTVIMTLDCWGTYVNQFGNLGALDNIEHEWIAAVLITSITSCAVQAFYATRLHKLSEKYFLTISILILACAQLVGGVITAVQSSKAQQWSVYESRLNVSEGLQLGAMTLADLIIAVSMVFYLLKKQPYTVLTRNAITSASRLFMETGVLTAMIVISSAALFYKFPNAALHAAPLNIIAMIHAVSALAILNNRIRIVGGRYSTPQDVDLHISWWRESDDTESGRATRVGRGGPPIAEPSIIMIAKDEEKTQQSSFTELHTQTVPDA